MVKRVIDAFCAAAGLVFLSPFLLWIAWRIKFGGLVKSPTPSLRGAKRRGNLLDIRVVMRLPRFARNDKLAFFGLFTNGSSLGTDNVQAAILNLKLKGYGQIVDRRRAIARLYNERLRDLDQLTLPPLGFGVNLPFTEALFERRLMLPMNMSLSDEDVRYVCEAIKEFYRESPK